MFTAITLEITVDVLLAFFSITLAIEFHQCQYQRQPNELTVLACMSDIGQKWNRSFSVIDSADGNVLII